MSIFRCVACDENRDSDKMDCMEWNDGLICEKCYGPKQYAIRDYEMGGGFDCNTYPKGSVDYIWYQEQMHDCINNESNERRRELCERSETLNKLRFNQDFKRIIGG